MVGISRARRAHQARALLLLAALAAKSGRAAADSASSFPRAIVRVAPPCWLPTDLAPLWQRLRVELAAEGVAWVDDVTRAPVTITLALATCGAGPLELTIIVSRAGAGQRSRVVSLRNASSPDGARTIALVIAELVRRAMQELTDAAPEDLAPPGAEPLPSSTRDGVPVAPVIGEPPPDSAAPREEREQGPTPGGLDAPRAADLDVPRTTARSAVAAELVARGYPSESTVLVGGRLRSSYLVDPSWALGVGLLGARGVHDVAIGRATIWCASAALGLTFGMTAGPLRIEVGPELEVGYARAQGSARHADVLAASGGGVFAVAGAGARLGGRLAPSWRWFVAADAGQTLLGILWKADATSSGGLSGLQLGSAAGAALVF